MGIFEYPVVLRIHLLVISFLNLVPFIYSINPNTNPGSFCYDDTMCDQDTSKWGGICKAGKSQSPIDIRLTPFLPYFAPTIKFDLNKDYGASHVHTFYGQNNGHTAQFDLTPNLNALTSDLEIGGGRLNAKYRFAQLHFHWAPTDQYGSEHLINGVSYPLEMHIVHYKSIYSSLADALKANIDDPEALAVMAVFFKIGKRKNEAFEPIVEALEPLEAPGEIKQFNLTLRISNLYPKKKEFARYMGSLTTPTCDEKVVWTVFLRPVRISRHQMDEFRKLTNEEHLSSFNYRRAQDLNGRVVNFYKGIFFLEPFTSLVKPFEEIINMIIHFFENMFNYFQKMFPVINRVSKRLF